MRRNEFETTAQQKKNSQVNCEQFIIRPDAKVSIVNVTVSTLILKLEQVCTLKFDHTRLTEAFRSSTHL